MKISEELLINYISDVWKEIDYRLRIEGDDINLNSWINVLGVFQSKADMFGLKRDGIGLPIEDADYLFIMHGKG